MITVPKRHGRTDSICDFLLAVAVRGWGQGAQVPQNLAQAPQIFRVITVHKLLNTGQLDTVVLLVVASQMMRGQSPPNIFFLEAPLPISLYHWTGLEILFYCDIIIIMLFNRQIFQTAAATARPPSRIFLHLRLAYKNLRLLSG